MPIHLQDLSILNWLWHDAELHMLRMEWLENGEVAAWLQSEINADEERQPLLDLGINTQLIEVQFRNVWLLRGNIMGYNSTREFIINWETVHPSALIKELKDAGLAGNLELVHHQVHCSGGTSFDVVFSQVWLDSVE